MTRPASAAKRPESPKTMIWMRLTGRPERRAASRLPPMAYMDRPSTVRSKMNQQIRPAMTIMTMGIGIPATVEPNQFTVGAVPMGEPSEMTKVAPRAMDIMASVAIKEGILPKAVAIPQMAPANRPVSRPAISVSQPGILTSVKKDAETIAPSAATEPTERSMPAVMMTKVMPNAKIATVAAWMPILRKLLTVKKCGVAINNATHK